jgi:4-amino-4-deoxy-L-arabinose transferase-like glycosyltransferase
MVRVKTSWREPRLGVSVVILMAVTLACLLPFLGKPIHMDDPLFIWTARQIQSHPLDFYGFNVSWETHPMPMSTVTQNPPLSAYYLAAVARILGWSEPALHFGFLFPALAAVLGTYFLARRFCAHPLAAALLTLATPVFLISSTGLMCDTPMLALWIWSILLWIDGLEGKSALKLSLAAMLIAACSLTKYFGVCLIPLLLVYSAMRERRAGLWLVHLFVPVLILAGYQWLTFKLYGRGLLLNAASYAVQARVAAGLPSKTLTALAFAGGCVAFSIPSLPPAWGRKGLAAGLMLGVVTALVVMGLKTLGVFSVIESGHVHWLFVAQFAAFAVGGMAMLALAIADVLKHRTPASMLLLLWTVGTFLFASVVNWTVSGRNILPLLPAAAILLTRRLESRAGAIAHVWWPLALSLAAGLMAAETDWGEADSQRSAAFSIQHALAGTASEIDYEGHWGFQYYMDQLGAKPLDRFNPRFVPNEMIVVPINNSFVFQLPAARVESWGEYRLQPASGMTLMSVAAGAGYYSDGWGPAPFIFGPAPLDDYVVFRVK